MMNSIPCSKRSVVFILLAVAVVGVVGTAAAVTVTDENVPQEVESEAETSATLTVSNLYDDAPSEWTLRAESNLTGDVTWQLSKAKFGNAGIENESGSGSSIETAVSQENDDEEITISVSGTMPNRSEYNYDPRQNLSAITLYRVSGDQQTEIGSADIEYFTENSKQARQAIESAREAIDAVGGNSEAEDTLQGAISSYDNENFGNAIRQAENAEEAAQETQQSQQTTQLLVFGGAGILVLALVGGGVWYWRNQQDDYDKLR